MIVWLAMTGVLLFAAVLLTFCVYEVSWKTRRLQGDLARLQGLSAQLGQVQSELKIVRRHLAARKAG